MKTFAILIAVWAGLPLAAQTFDRTKPPASPEPRPYKLPPVYETKLPNGFTVLLADDPRFPLVSARLVFHGGNKRDPKDIPGLAAAVASMLMEGTASRSSQQIAEELDGLGGVISANASADAVTISSSVLAENTPKILALMADVAHNATFPQNELDLYRQNRKQTLNTQHANPGFLANEEFRKRLFGETPYAHVGPTSASIDRFDQKTIAGFRDTYFVPNNGVLILVGKLPARAQIMKTITDQFGAWQQKAVPAWTPEATPAPKRQLVLVDRPGSVQADIRMGKIGVTQNNTDYFPLSMGSLIEGGGISSRLFLDIREKRGYTYDAHTEMNPLADAGTFSAVTEVRNDVAAPALEAVLEHLDRIATEPVSKEELSDAKTFANGSFLLSMEPQRGLADRLVQMKVMNLPKDYLDTYTTKVNSVEPDQIESAAKKYMAPAEDAIIVVGDAAALAEQLKKVGNFEVVKPVQ